MAISIIRDKSSAMRHQVHIDKHIISVDELSVNGDDISKAQRQELLMVAGKCPVHKLMTTVKQSSTHHWRTERQCR